jgi:hypothetical protein
MPVIFSRGDQSSPIYVVAYDTAGGPRHLVSGRGIAEKDEIVVDAALARKYGFAPGDSVEFLGHTFKIAGLSADGTNFFNPYVFARLEDVVDLYLAGDLPEELATNAALSFLLVDLEPGPIAMPCARRSSARCPRSTCSPRQSTGRTTSDGPRASWDRR